MVVEEVGGIPPVPKQWSFEGFVGGGVRGFHLYPGTGVYKHLLGEGLRGSTCTQSLECTSIGWGRSKGIPLGAGVVSPQLLTHWSYHYQSCRRCHRCCLCWPASEVDLSSPRATPPHSAECLAAASCLHTNITRNSSLLLLLF